MFDPGIFTYDDKPYLLLSVSRGLGAGFFEELGRRGFTVPHLRLRYGFLTTGFIAGVLWGAWHSLTNNFWGERHAFRSHLPTLFSGGERLRSSFSSNCPLQGAHGVGLSSHWPAPGDAHARESQQEYVDSRFSGDFRDGPLNL
jgi:hypothetical protein